MNYDHIIEWIVAINLIGAYALLLWPRK